MTKTSILRRQLRSLALLTGPAMVLFLLGRIFAVHSSGALLVLAEPLVLGAGLYIAGALALHRRWRMSVSALIALGTGAMALHFPVDRTSLRTQVPDWVRTLRGCAILPQASETPVRLVTWTVDDSLPLEETLAQIIAQRPDLVVLQGTDDRKIGTALGDALQGEVKFFPGGEGITAAVRGSFQYCGGTTDHWSIDLPARSGHVAEAIVTFPHIEHVGALPLVIARPDQHDGIMDLNRWAQRLVQSSNVVGAAAQTIGPRRMLVVGDFHVPSRAQPMAYPLRRAGLRAVSTPPNWPTNLAGVPLLPVHALDQMWAGRGWHAQRARVIEAAGHSRKPILVDLTPADANAR